MVVFGNVSETRTVTTTCYLNDGTGHLVASAACSAGLDPVYAVDTIPDYPWFNGMSGLLMEGSREMKLQPSVVFGDIDRDGLIDLAIGNQLYRNGGAANGWQLQATFYAPSLTAFEHATLFERDDGPPKNFIRALADVCVKEL